MPEMNFNNVHSLASLASLDVTFDVIWGNFVKVTCYVSKIKTYTRRNDFAKLLCFAPPTHPFSHCSFVFPDLLKLSKIFTLTVSLRMAISRDRWSFSTCRASRCAFTFTRYQLEMMCIMSYMIYVWGVSQIWQIKHAHHPMLQENISRRCFQRPVVKHPIIKHGSYIWVHQHVLSEEKYDPRGRKNMVKNKVSLSLTSGLVWLACVLALSLFVCLFVFVFG